MIKTLFIYFLLMLSPAVLGQTINVVTLSKAPKLDGQDSDWRDVAGNTIKLSPIQAKSTLGHREVLLKAGHYQGQVFFYLKWPDKTQNIIHKPYMWNEKKQRYVKGPQREDRLALQFEISGEYSTDWANAMDFEADMWHWKSSRSNPLELAHDKKTTLSKNKLLRAASIPSADGSKRYVRRVSDTGTPIYRNLRYGTKEQEIMPKYQLHAKPEGSIADVKAKGVWKDGYWQLELRRKLDTGHNDDVKFVLGQSVRGGISVFDASENDNHIISETLLFQF